jgi:hypothetical protein
MLACYAGMNKRTSKRTIFTLCVAGFFLVCTSAPIPAQQAVDTHNPLDAKYRPAIKAFDDRVKAYAKLREELETKIPKLANESTPEQIQAHQKRFVEVVVAARAGAKPGDVLQPDIAEYIRATIKNEFTVAERANLIESVREADTKGVPLVVNAVYPPAKEAVEMPPTLLLKLPSLPKQVKYRFVGTNLLLVDRENDLIVDFMANALPAREARTVADKPPEKTTPVPTTPAASTIRLVLPLKEGSVRFGVIGDTGSGTEGQQELADVMHRYHEAFPFEFVLMLGDNLYGAEKAVDYRTKFADVYRVLLEDKVKFYAALGNHDETDQRKYEHFNMEGKEYYRITKGSDSFYGLNSNYMDKRQVEWLEGELAKDTSKWKIAFFHHPPYSSGKQHGSDKQLREVVEPIFLKHGVNLVLAGHEHFYERIKPQKGIYYFISGAGGKLREGGINSGSPLTEKSYDKDLNFMLFEVDGDEAHFQVITRTGETVDSGVLVRQRADKQN